MTRLRILYSSNAFFSPSGYGVQGGSLLPRLQKLACVEDVRQLAWYGLQGGAMEVNGIKCYPGGFDPYGNDVIGPTAKDMNANLVITLIDAFVLQDVAQKVAPALFAPWFPIDHDPIPDAVLRGIAGAYRPLVYSKWAAQMMAQRGLNCTYIPHGIEPAVMKILPAEERRKLRHEAGIPQDAFLAVMVAANKGYPDRKAFQHQFRAFAMFAAEHPDAMLYVHTLYSPEMQGLDLVALANNLGIAHKVRFPPRETYKKGYPHDYVASVYNAGDVLLAATMSEGFGIPIIEAQACGLPVLVTDFSAMPELARWGFRVPPLDYVWTPLNAWQAWPDARAIYQGLQWAYAERQAPDLLARRQAVSAQIHAEYGWDVIVEQYWQPFLEEAAAHLEKPVPLPLRAWQPPPPPAPIVTELKKNAAAEPPVVEQTPMRWAGDTQSTTLLEAPVGMRWAGDTGNGNG
jgi:glycosyltransferase involved in cell wall biosynthesis